MLSQIPIELFETYQPQESWLFHDSSVHGIGHLTRVFILQELICDNLEAKNIPVNREALRWASIAHDVGRLDDGKDFEHGQRSAHWMKEHLSKLMSPETLDTAAYIVHWHVPSDDEAPEMTTELQVLKDADALDRARLGDLNVKYLRTEAARELVATAEQLFHASLTSTHEKETHADVLRAAKSLGLVRKDS